MREEEKGGNGYGGSSFFGHGVPFLLLLLLLPPLDFLFSHLLHPIFLIVLLISLLLLAAVRSCHKVASLSRLARSDWKREVAALIRPPCRTSEGPGLQTSGTHTPCLCSTSLSVRSSLSLTPFVFTRVRHLYCLVSCRWWSSYLCAGSSDVESCTPAFSVALSSLGWCNRERVSVSGVFFCMQGGGPFSFLEWDEISGLWLCPWGLLV